MELQYLSEQYLNASISGEKKTSREVMESAISNGMSVFDIYNEVIAPALQEIGNRWSDGRITVCQEHLATQITLEQMTLLRELISPKPPLKRTALVTTLPSDQHIVGARMVADYFYADGWTVEFLGPDTPISDIVSRAKEREVDLVLISLSSLKLIGESNVLSKQLRSLEKPPTLILGGRVINEIETKDSLRGVDLFAHDPVEAVREARRLCGVSGSEESLEQILRHLGLTIKRLRADKGMSQKALSQAAELDRAYLSSIENGKKNLSLSAMLRLSEALGVSLEELIRA
jgi:methanogenic corrinoid protein MtbC1/DNA-binding Xre family transcriptional regulator